MFLSFALCYSGILSDQRELIKFRVISVAVFALLSLPGDVDPIRIDFLYQLKFL